MSLYHVLCRGVDKRTIFRDDRDYLRFIYDLSIFNDTNLKNNANTSFNRKECIDIRYRYTEERPRDLIVNIHAFCLMPNHYHIFVSPIKEDGLSHFFRKLNIGYAKYFNIKYERKGALFETRFKRIEIGSEAHFIHLPYYIHSNPLDLADYGWRAREIKNRQAAWEFLKNYRWSSHLDYLGKENFPLATQREFLLEFFGGTDRYQIAFQQWISDMKLPPSDIIMEK
jgi:putative transposase